MKVYYESPVGILEIEDNYGHIVALRVVKEVLNTAQPITETLAEAIKQLDEYFAGERLDFDLPLMQEGTDFQQRAWEYLCNIPYGETVSYKEQAYAIGSPKGFRAVGSANGKNNIAIIVPCHRVVNEGKGLGGYAYGLDVKCKLLDLEQRHKRNNK